MATINGLTAAAMRAIRDGAIVGASVDISGHLMLEKFDGTFLDTGSVIGPEGPVGPAGPVPEAPADNVYYVRRNGAWIAVPVTDAIAASTVVTSSIAPFENTTASTWADLATIGPVVNATIRASGRALVMASAWIFNNISAAPTSMSYEISGASTRAPQDADAVLTFSDEISATRASIVTGLTPGVNTFTAKYKAMGGDGAFGFRSLTVIPL